MSDRFGMTDNYLIHSAKGTSWKNHKYIKKVGNKYYYKDEKGELVEGNPSDNGDILTETKESTTSSSKSKKSTETDRIKALANKVMAGKLGQNQLRKATSSKDYIKVMNTINNKFKKPSSSGSSSKNKEKDKKTSEKKTKEKKTSEKKTTEKSNSIEKDKTNQTTNQVVETKNKVDTTPKTEEAKTETKSESTTSTDNTVSANIKSAIKSVTTITDNDSIYATKNKDGTTTVTVDFEDGTTQTFTLAQTFDVISKTEKTKKQLTHFIGEYKNMSDRFGMTGNYLIHSAKGTSWEKKDHKYTYKKKINGKWKYFYTIKDLEEAEKELKDAENNEDSIGGRYRSEYTKERIDNLGKYKRGEYFDKDHPGNMAAYYQNEDYALQRMSSDANKALKRVENAKENLNKIENSKSGKIAKTIRDTSKSVKKFVDTGNVVIDGTGYQIIPKKKK